VYVVGHRGASREAPENTIASFETALRLGADAVETDVCITRDREFVLWHDADPDEKLALARQAAAEKLLVIPDVPEVGSPWRKPVRELELAAMRKHYGYQPREGPAKKKPRIPFARLGDLLAWTRKAERLRRVYLDIKLAEDQVEEAKRLFETVSAFVHDTPEARGPSFHLLTVHGEIVQALLEASRGEPDPARISVYADFERPGVLHFAPRVGARCVGLGRRGRVWPGYCSELARVIAGCRSGTLTSVVAWTLNDEKELRSLLRMGTPAIMTDEIEGLRRLVDRRAPKSRTKLLTPPPSPSRRTPKAPFRPLPPANRSGGGSPRVS
jgi:glycerophosphoryl diester phosphodiesterase